MKALDICSQSRWQNLCDSLDISDDGKIFDKLVKAHAEPQRAYHTLDHIAACLRHLDGVKSKTVRPQEIEMALWFHDAVYQPFSATNEEDSAQWAVDWLTERGTAEPVIDRIKDHILATKAHDAPKDLDRRYMFDIDLSILGTPPDIYDEFEDNIRREYKRVPRIIFRKKRKAILKRFLSRSKIYMTSHFHNALEEKARDNIARAISKL